MTDLFKKLFFHNNYFTIALRRRSTRSILKDFMFLPDYIMSATAERWVADPILVDDQNGKTWLFFEAVENNHGHIEVAEVLPDASLGDPVVLLKDACHYSYPFVFHWEGSWYMIPESSAAGEVRLYQAAEFPYRWNQKMILLRQKAVDTTVFEKDGQLFLLTFLIDGFSERVTPQAYLFSMKEDGASLTPIKWNTYDELRVRGAGPVFFEDELLYRPVQLNQLQQYGNGVSFCCISVNKSDYHETTIGTLHFLKKKRGKQFFDGAHTYCRYNQYEAIDLRCRDFDFWKIPRRALSGISSSRKN